MARSRSIAARSAALIHGQDDDARACREIPDAACHAQPRNFRHTLAALTLTKTGDELSGARLVLAWLLLAVGAPEFLLALLVPIRESGALLPQLVVAAIIRRAPIRKTFWIAGNVVQGLCLMAMGGVALQFSGGLAGALIIGLLVIFSLARGVCSVAIKDVMGKTIDKGARGRLTGWATSAAGVLAIGAGVLVQWAGQSGLSALAALLFAAGALWWLAAAIYTGVEEWPGATDGGRNALQEALSSLTLLRDDRPFRHYCLTRALLLSTAFAFPFYAAIASRHGAGDMVGLLGMLVVVSGMAGMVAAPLWGHWSDRSSRHVMMAAATLAGLLGLGVGIGEWRGQLTQAPAMLLLAMYFVIAVAHHGVRIARSTYLIDLGHTGNRAAYTAVSNTLIGLLLLLGSGIGVLAHTLGIGAVLMALGGMALCAAVAAYRLPPP